MDTLASGENVRQPEWSYRTAVGSEAFVQEVLRQLKGQGEGARRRMADADGRHQVREEAGPYNAHFEAENDALSLDNGYLWENCI